jgi:hypothetical protein
LEFEYPLGFDFCDLEFGYPMLETDFPVLNPNHNLNQMLDGGCLFPAHSSSHVPPDAGSFTGLPAD